MKGAVDEGKDISPMFPRLHVKDAEKGGPKAPPRNKMALYEQFSIPSQSFASGSASLFPLPLRNSAVPSTSSHVGGSQSIQFCMSSAPSFLAEKIQAYHSRKINLTKFTQDNFSDSKNSLKTLDGEDAFITSGSALGKNSCCSIIQNDKDEDKLAHCNSSSSLKSLNSFKRKVNSTEAREVKSVQYGKNQMEEHPEVSQIGQKPEEGSACQLAGFGDMTDASLISLMKVRNSTSMKKEGRSLKEEIRSILVDRLTTLQGSNSQIHEENAAFGDEINLRDHYLEKPAASDVRQCPGGLEIGRRCFVGKRDRNQDEKTYRHYHALNKPSSECLLGMNISPDSVLEIISEKQFWKARRTLINQQRIFLVQVFELHRLIKVQRLIAGSPHLFLDDSLQLNKQPLKASTPKKLQLDSNSKQPSSVVKLNSKSEKPMTAEHAKNNVVEKIPHPSVNNTSKSLVNQVSNYGHHLGNPTLAPPAINTKQSPCCVYPPPGNQWLVPVMSPSEGLVYKPIIGPCPPNAGFMAPAYGACGTMSLNPGSKDVLDTAFVPSSHQRIGILSGTPLPQFLPPCGPPIMHPSVAGSAVEQMMESNGPENHHSAGDVNSSILPQSSSNNMSSQMSQVMSRHNTTYQSSKDQELQRSTASSPSKRKKGDVLPLFPLAPTCWPSSNEDTNVDHQPRVIKALPHNPKSATESAARIFRSIQEERKHL